MGMLWRIFEGRAKRFPDGVNIGGRWMRKREKSPRCRKLKGAGLMKNRRRSLWTSEFQMPIGVGQGGVTRTRRTLPLETNSNKKNIK